MLTSQKVDMLMNILLVFSKQRANQNWGQSIFNCTSFKFGKMEFDEEEVLSNGSDTEVEEDLGYLLEWEI